jgi:hypothetical protein
METTTPPNKIYQGFNNMNTHEFGRLAMVGGFVVLGGP